MQEYHVTAAGRTYELERPFFVLATQNPIELEGTYPLPEAQLDRFMFNIVMKYLSEDEEVRVVTETTAAARPQAVARAGRRRHPADPGAGAAGAGGRRRRAVRRAAGERVAARARRPRRQARLRRHVGAVGRRAARQPGAHPRRQGARADARPLSRLGRRHPRAGAADPAAPHHHQLLRRVRARGLRRHHHAAARGRARAAAARCRNAPCASAAPASFAFSTRRSSPGSARSNCAPSTIVEGFLSGLHRSPLRGFSVEFAEYRQYFPGDELSTIDWKVYARTDRYVVKKFEEETNLKGYLLLDVSGSMAYGSGSLTKLEYGSVLAASLAYLMQQQRDAAGLVDLRRHASAPSFRRACARAT